MSKIQVLQSISDCKIVAVIRGNTPNEALSIAKSAYEGGVKVIEITYTTPHADRVIEALRDSEMLIGAGTVLDSETARNALLNGAEFIVSPHFDKRISELCNRYSVPYIPGCLTISEMISAMESGCDIIKLFPANNFPRSFIQTVKGPLPHVHLMVTGGVNIENFTDWLKQGAFAIGIGSDLSKAYTKGGAVAVVERCKRYISTLEDMGE